MDKYNKYNTFPVTPGPEPEDEAAPKYPDFTPGPDPVPAWGKPETMADPKAKPVVEPDPFQTKAEKAAAKEAKAKAEAEQAEKDKATVRFSDPEDDTKTNAYTVKVKHGSKKYEYQVWTGADGVHLWVDGVQVQTAFGVGSDAQAAIRTFFEAHPDMSKFEPTL